VRLDLNDGRLDPGGLDNAPERFEIDVAQADGLALGRLAG
jgi:hypothetical protein